LNRPDIEAIGNRANAATRGPWEATETHGHDFVWLDVTCNENLRPQDDEIACGEPQPHPSIVHKSCIAQTEERKQEILKDLDFIAHARTDIPALIAYIRELEADKVRLDWLIHFMVDKGFECSISEPMNGHGYRLWERDNDITSFVAEAETPRELIDSAMKYSQ
jgi:hypothetical protein